MEFFAFSIVTVLLTHQVSGASIVAPNRVSSKHANLVSKLSNFRYTRPYRSTPEGGFVTYDLSPITGHTATRFRRSADDEGATYNFVVQSVDGEDLLLNLEKVTDLFSPSFIVQRFTEDDGVAVETPETDCFFQGHVGNMANTTVAVSSCHGLNGLITVGDDEYIIEPVDFGEQPSLTRATDDQGVHIIYRTTDHEGHAEAVDLLRPINLVDDEVVTRSSDDLVGRLKRSDRRLPTDRTHYVKTMLVADSSMQEFHGDSVTLYMATLMNIVNKVYAHESLGLNIKFGIVKVVLLNQRKSSNIIAEGTAPLTSLRNANKWAVTQNTHPEEANHFDMTFYLTQRNFGASGYANVGGLCRMSLSAALVLDREGLRCALVAAHEAAHLFGVEHDVRACRKDGESSAVMAAYVTANFHDYFWSSCSKNQLSRKFRSGDLDCLRDPLLPPDLGNEVTTYPGLQSTLDEQCRFNYGPQALACPDPTCFTYDVSGETLTTASSGTCSVSFPHAENKIHPPRTRNDYDPCVTLYCLMELGDENCRAPSRTSRPLEGTPCGESKWCIQGECQLRTNFAVSEAVYEWHASEWGACSITCGGDGQKSREVTCREVTYDKDGRLEGISDPVGRSHCHPELKPAKITVCQTRACSAEWITGPWSECDVSCGEGRETRSVTCDIPRNSNLDYQCWSSKPDKTRRCQLDECPETGECVPAPGPICKAKNYMRYCMMPGYEEQCCYTCAEQEERIASWRGKRTRE